VNVLFVNYGNFTTNSLNHIAGFAAALSARGHDCVVAVPAQKETLAVIPDPRFTAATYAEVLARPAFFRDDLPADVIHAWTPREGVRKFVLAYQRLQPGTRLVVHLEDNEEHLIATFGATPLETLRELPQQNYPFPLVDGLPHPVRYHHLLRLADAVTVIVDRLAEFAPPDRPVHLLQPGVDFAFYHPRPADAALRRELGLHDGEKVIVFTGSVTFANLAEMRALYDAVKRLNEGGTPTRLVRTGITHPDFASALGYSPAAFVLELGFIEKARLPALLALADVLVQPGAAGAFNDYRLPSKLPEFLSSGRPVVLPATNIGTRLIDGRDALLLRTGFAEEIAAACMRLFRDPALAEKLGRAAGEFARANFDLAANTAGLERLYQAVAAAPANPVWAGLQQTVETELPVLLAQLRRRLAALPAPGASQDAAVWRAALAELDDLGRAGRQLDFDLQLRAGQITDHVRHAAGLQQTVDILREDVAVLRAEAARILRELEAEVKESAALAEQLYDREVKIHRMQASFSWRATAWLRALRRTVFEPILGKPELSAPPRPVRPPRATTTGFGLVSAAAGTHAHLDAPRRWPLEATSLVVRGWLVSTAGKNFKEVRARVGDRTYPGQYGLGRPDVGHNFKQVPTASQSGFSITVDVAATDTQIDLEAADAGGTWQVFFRQPLGAGQADAPKGTYAHWVRQFDTFNREQLDQLARRAAALLNPPLISILMPVYNPPQRWLLRAIESVRRQAYQNWELCLADDASTQPHVRATLERYAAEDKRIKVVFRPENGHISAASNSALEAATGEFCALLDHDDELAPHALLLVAEAILAVPDVEVIYSDEDKIDETGNRFDPHFKPDWNPDLLTGQNYLSHLTTYRTATLRAVHGFRRGFEGAQDWDLALRITERVKPEQIHHVPHVLYHWRAAEGSTALQLQEKEYAAQAARRALTEHFARTGQPVELSLVAGNHWRVRRPRPEPAPLVTLVIPTRNRRELLLACVESIFARTSYPNFEILIADNDSDDPELFAYYERRKAQGRFTVLPCPGPFNYAAINNRGVAHAKGEIVGLLNNDLEVISPEWLDEMVAQAVRPGIGCVGAKLYYGDLRVQHAGVITGLGGVAGHVFKGITKTDPGTPQFRPHLVQNLTAVTAACLLVRKAVYQQVGGMDAAHLTVAFNDVDFCLKVQAAGFRNLFTPHAELLHHESASRGAEDSPEKVRRFQGEIDTIRSRWGERLLHDPAYNPNLTLDSEDFGLAYPPRTAPTATATGRSP